MHYPICEVSAARQKIQVARSFFLDAQQQIGFCFVKFSGFPNLAALGLGLMMLHYVIVKTVNLVSLTWMHQTGCSREARLVLHLPSSSCAGKHTVTARLLHQCGSILHKHTASVMQEGMS